MEQITVILLFVVIKQIILLHSAKLQYYRYKIAFDLVGQERKAVVYVTIVRRSRRLCACVRRSQYFCVTKC